MSNIITAHVARHVGLLRTTDTTVSVRLTGEKTEDGKDIGVVLEDSAVWPGKLVKIEDELREDGAPLIHAHNP